MAALFYVHVVNEEKENPLIGMKEIEENFQASMDLEPEVYSYCMYQMGMYLRTGRIEEARALVKILMALEDQSPSLKDFFNGI